MAVYRCRVCGYIFDEEKEGKSIRDIDIDTRQPVHHKIKLVDDFVIVKILGCNRNELRTALYAVLLIKSAVNRMNLHPHAVLNRVLWRWYQSPSGFKPLRVF